MSALEDILPPNDDQSPEVRGELRLVELLEIPGDTSDRWRTILDTLEEAGRKS